MNIKRKKLCKVAFGAALSISLSLPVVYSSEVSAAVEKISNAIFGDVQISLDRSDMKYIDGEDVVVRAKINKRPAAPSFGYDVEAVLTVGGKSTYLKRADLASGYFAQFPFKMQAGVSLEVRTYLVNQGKRASLEKELSQLNAELQKVNELILESSTPQLEAKKSSLEQRISGIQTEVDLTRKLLSSELINPELVSNDISITITAPTASEIKDDEVVLSGVIHGNLPGVDIYVDAEKIGSFSDNQTFSYELNSLFEGRQFIKVEAKRGEKTIAMQMVEFLYLNANSKAGPVDTTGGSVKVTDTASKFYGTEIVIPSGAMTAQEQIMIVAGDESELPESYKVVSENLKFEPMLMHFLKEAAVTIPVDVAKFPAGITINDVKIMSSVDGIWTQQLVTARTTNSVTFRTKDLEYDSLVAATSNPVMLGQMRIESEPTGADIFLDGADTGLITPAILEGIQAGLHEITVFKDGYNEVSKSVQYTVGRSEFITLTKQPKVVPQFDFGNSVYDGMEVSEALINVSGAVSYNGTNPSTGILVARINGYDTRQGTSSYFISALPLIIGENTIQFRYTTAGVTGVSPIYRVIRNPVAIFSHSSKFPDLYINSDEVNRHYRDKYSNRPVSQMKRTPINNLAEDLKQDIRVIINWGKDDTDVDLHIYDDKGNHAWYSDLEGIPGGRLDRDDISGLGPETFVAESPLPGTYTVRAHYYSDHDNGPTNVTAQVYIGGKKYSAAKTYTTMSKGGWWDIATFKINANLKIEEVVGAAGKSKEPKANDCSKWRGVCVPARFNAGSGESVLKVTTKALDSIKDDEISYTVTEMYSGATVSGIRGREPYITLPFVRRDSGEFKRKIEPLVYKIEAEALGEKSEPYYVVQDIRSRIRQEYIDLKIFSQNNREEDRFSIEPPDYEVLRDSGPVPGSIIYTWSDFIAKPKDYGNFGFIEFAGHYATKANIAWQNAYLYSEKLRITSGWRGPRKNWQLAMLENGAVNSHHQMGSALDFGAPKDIPKTSDRHKKYRTVFHEMCELIHAALKNDKVKALPHNSNHLHVQMNREGGSGNLCFKIK